MLSSPWAHCHSVHQAWLCYDANPFGAPGAFLDRRCAAIPFFAKAAHVVACVLAVQMLESQVNLVLQRRGPPENFQNFGIKLLKRSAWTTGGGQNAQQASHSLAHEAHPKGLALMEKDLNMVFAGWKKQVCCCIQCFCMPTNYGFCWHQQLLQKMLLFHNISMVT